MLVGVPSRSEARPVGRAQVLGHKDVREGNSVARNGIQVQRLEKLVRLQKSECVVTMIAGQDDNVAVFRTWAAE